MKSSDPMSTPWVDAYLYIQSYKQRSAAQLLEDHETFVDPPDDEIGRQNAALKRTVAIEEISRRVEQGQVEDLREVKGRLEKSLRREPDEFVRVREIGLLNTIAERGGRGLRTQIIELFERELREETGGLDRAALDVYLEDLKGN